MKPAAGIEARALALRGGTFTTPKELRHLAETALGLPFVPTEILTRDDTHARVLLCPAGTDRLLVSARRERRWSRFHIERVEPLSGADDAAR